MRNLTYEERMHSLGLNSLEYQRLFSDLVVAFKIYKGLSVVSTSELFELPQRESRLRILAKYSAHDFRKYTFGNRVVNAFNRLPESIIQAKSAKEFKHKLLQFDLCANLQKYKF